MIDHYAVKACTTLLHQQIPAAVKAYPADAPETIASGLVARMTSDECRVILEQLVAHRIQTAQQLRAHQRHQVSGVAR